jgi:hypothetical protein
MLHLEQVDILPDCRRALENFESCLRIVLTDCCTASSFDREDTVVEDGVSVLKILLTDCCTALWFNDDREAFIPFDEVA